MFKKNDVQLKKVKFSNQFSNHLFVSRKISAITFLGLYNTDTSIPKI